VHDSDSGAYRQIWPDNRVAWIVEFSAQGNKTVFCLKIIKKKTIKSAIESLRIVTITYYLLVLAFSRDFSHFQVPGLLDLFSPGTTGPWDLQGL
jgi:hypothetical protein